MLLSAGAAVGQRPADVLRVGDRRPHEVVVARADTWDRGLPLDTEMGRLVAGVLARYDRQSVGRLLRCATGDPLPREGLDTARRVAVLHLSSRGDETQRVEVLRFANGTLGARWPGAPDGVRLETARFDALASAWPAYRGGLEPVGADATGESVVMARPYVPGAITVDARLMKQRLYRGLPVRVADPDRDLVRETLHARLPAGYDPRQPAGLLVWSSPTASGRIPAALHAGLDELGLVCVAADDAGNERDVPDKFQLVFDCLATARQRYHLDDRRVYLAGLSGGAKVASILTLCFPEHFAGAVPIAGLATHSRLDASWGRYRPAYFVRPRDRVLALARRRRLAPMSGPADFNYKEMVERTTLLEADGFEQVRFFDYPDMAHEMPTPQRLAEALRWIDEPYQRLRDAETTRASALLAAYLEERDGAAPPTAEDRAALQAVIEAAPWSDAAWRALERSRRPTPAR